MFSRMDEIDGDGEGDSGEYFALHQYSVLHVNITKIFKVKMLINKINPSVVQTIGWIVWTMLVLNQPIKIK